MKKFLGGYGIEHGQSSPYNPKSNGHAEKNVQIVKHLLLKTENSLESEEFLDGLAQIRNTPRADGFSPNQVVFGRSVRTLVPSLTEALGTNDIIERSRGRKRELDSRQKTGYDSTAQDLKQLQVGTQVLVQNAETKRWDEKAEIIGHPRGRTYELRLANGRITHRNRKMIRKWHASNNSSPKNCIAEEKIPPDITNSPRRSERIRKKVQI